MVLQPGAGRGSGLARNCAPVKVALLVSCRVASVAPRLSVTVNVPVVEWAAHVGPDGLKRKSEGG